MLPVTVRFILPVALDEVSPHAAGIPEQIFRVDSIGSSPEASLTTWCRLSKKSAARDHSSLLGENELPAYTHVATHPRSGAGLRDRGRYQQVRFYDAPRVPERDARTLADWLESPRGGTCPEEQRHTGPLVQFEQQHEAEPSKRGVFYEPTLSSMTAPLLG